MRRHQDVLVHCLTKDDVVTGTACCTPGASLELPEDQQLVGTVDRFWRVREDLEGEPLARRQVQADVTTASSAKLAFEF